MPNTYIKLTNLLFMRYPKDNCQCLQHTRNIRSLPGVTMVRAGIEKLKNLADQEHCSTKLALSFCVGVYIAFSPFIGLHTVMTFIFVWLFGLNLAATFTASWLINNPWTMIPIYSTDYF